MWVWLTLASGLALLTVGAELLVRGASRMAAAAKISPLVVGLTVVAYGTSMPELVVSARSSLQGQAGIAVGNVLGSNIFNVLFILGLSALIIPLRVQQQLIRFDVPLLIGLSLLVTLLAADGAIGFVDGLLLLSGLIAYTVWGVLQSRREQVAVEREYADEFAFPALSKLQLLAQLAFVVVGLALLVTGAGWFTQAAVQLARHWELSELVIGLTIVAAGTSLPEVATSIVAAVKGERDIAVGNVIGSNLFNLLGVLGFSGLVASQGVPVTPAALSFDFPVMIAVSFACLPIFFSGQQISRWEGGLFLFYWLAYTVCLIAAETREELTRTMGLVMFGFVIPLTVLTLLVTTVGSMRNRRRSPE